MKLTTNQINQIDETLELNKVVYDDVKLEVTDHIASDIEEIMADENVSFETALKEAFEKWRELLKPSRRGFSGFRDTPKLISSKFIEQTKRQLLFLVLVTVTMTSFVWGILKISDNEFVMDVIRKVYSVFYVILLVLLVVFKYLIKKSKVKTVYGFIYKSNFPVAVALMVSQAQLLIYFQITNVDVYEDILSLFFLNIMLIFGGSSFCFVYKHFQFERKLKTV